MGGDWGVVYTTCAHRNHLCKVIDVGVAIEDVYQYTEMQIVHPNENIVPKWKI